MVEVIRRSDGVTPGDVTRDVENVALIYDVGAHRGEDTDFYLKKGFNVVAIEANPSLAADLRARFESEVGAGQLDVVETAISENPGPTTFYVNEQLTVWGTTSSVWAERNRKLGAPSAEITVEARAFGEVLREHGVPYYLKIDIEGADLLCVQALDAFLSRPSFVSIESSTMSWAAVRHEFRLLARLGYTRFKVVNQNSVQTQVEPHPTREGRRTGHRFQHGSTGLFGKDLPGPWLTHRQALVKYFLIHCLYFFFGNNTLGERIARKLPTKVMRHFVRWYDTHARHESSAA